MKFTNTYVLQWYNFIITNNVLIEYWIDLKLPHVFWS